MRIVTTILLIAGICVTGLPLMLQWESSQQLTHTAANAKQHVAGWPYPDAENALKQAQQYNREIASSEQPVLGEGMDPFTVLSGGSKAQREDSAASQNKRYQSLLDSGNGVMGTIRHQHATYACLWASCGNSSSRPDPSNAHDARSIALFAAGVIVVCGWSCIAMIRRFSDAPRLATRHVAVWPHNAARADNSKGSFFA